jgi:hypothetical protein
MSDLNPGAGLDAVLDASFAAVGHPVTDDRGAAVLPPNAQHVDWSAQGERQAALEKDAKKAAKGQDKPAKDKQEAKDAADDEKPGQRGNDAKRANDAKHQEGRDGAIDKALERSAEAQKKKQESRKAESKGEKPRPMAPKDFAASRDHRRAIKDVFSGEKLSTILASAEKLDAELRRDPSMATIQKLASELLKLSPSKKTEKTEASEGRSKALDRGFEDSGDLDDIKEFSEKYGERLPEILANISHWAPQLKEDPFGALAKLAASMGGLDQPEQPSQAQPAQQSPPPASPQEEHDRVRMGVEKAIEHNILPALKNDDVAEAVAMVLTHMPRTNDRFADLRTAYGIVVGQASPAATAREAPDPKGKKSISGAANMNSGGSRPRGRSGSLDAALDAAFGR